MKTRIIKIQSLFMLALTLVAFSISSCSLEEKPNDFSDPKDFFKSKELCEASVRSTYLPLRSIYTFTYMLAIEGCSDLMYAASGTKDAQALISPANPLFGSTMWSQGYKGVAYCNAAIAGVQGAPLKDDEKFALVSEAVIMRAFYYYFLTSTFGDVPFYTKDVSNANVLEEVAHMGRMPATATRDYLIKELLEYLPKMDPIRSSEVKDNHCGAAMGYMLLGKLAMWNKKWEVARDAMLQLKKIYGDLSQYPYSDVMFRNKNTPESIFEIQTTYSTTGLKVTTNVAAVCTPYKGKDNKYDGVDIPELGEKTTTYTALRPNNYFYAALQTKIGGDQRVAYNLAWEYNGIPFKSATVCPWLGPKFWCPGMNGTSDFNNPKVFRYADALLMLSECYTMLQQSDLAMDALNQIKDRAGIARYDVFKNYDDLLYEIQKERGRELFGEFMRKYDLVRWGIWFTQTFDYTDYSSLKLNIRPCHEYYPIPDKEVVYSGYALDNNAYKADGF